MTLSDKIAKLRNLKQDYKKIANIVSQMATNEDSPRYDSAWAK